MAKLLFKWTEKELIVANTGRPFTASGLQALCSSHVTEEEQAKQIASAETAQQLVTEIRRHRLEAYKLVPEDVKAHANLEIETGRDYSNRLLLELMQNADDAAASVAIGYKGLGFKSVLDICEAARIYSGHLRVRFDREATRQALQEKSISFQDEVPALRLPFWNDQDDDADVPELLGEYDTVIVLPWKNGEVPSQFAQEWGSVRSDPTVLLLLHALQEVIWEGPQHERVEWRCERADEIRLSISENGREPQNSRWRIFRREEDGRQTVVAVPLDEGGIPRSYRHDKLRVFFPTEELSPLPMILHGEFDLEQNRKHVRPDNTRKAVIESLAACVKQALAQVTDDGGFLDLLRPRIPVENMTGLEREIWDAIRAQVQDMKLPVSGVRLADARLRPTDQPLATWKAFKELLGEHRPGGLAGLNVLLPETDTEQREKTVCAFNPKAHFSIEDLRRSALFPVAGTDTPVAAADCSLFYPPESRLTADALPGVPIAFLRGEFAAECRKQKPVCQLLKNLGVAEFSPEAIAEALAKSDFAAVPHKSLWQFLLSTVAPMLNDKDAVMNWRNKSRATLTERVRVPCRDAAWEPAINVYAGREWTGNDFLERAYGTQRHFLEAPPSDEEQRKRVERLARWLGVGWSPKVLPIVNFEDKAETKEGPRWQHSQFLVTSPPSFWLEHCGELSTHSRYDFDDYTARLRQDWTIDGDAEILRMDGAFENIVNEWRAYSNYLSAVIYRSSNMQLDKDNERVPSSPSYVTHLFEHVEWIPTEADGSLKAANDVFIKDSTVQQALAGWVFAPASDVPAEVAKGIGIRHDWSEVAKDDWERWLKRSLELMPEDNPNHQKLIIALYQNALRQSGDRCEGRDQRLWSNDIWCIEKRPDNTTIWHREANCNKVYYVDRPDLARLHLPSVKVFPVELGWSGNRERARQLFGVQPLSEHLRGDPAFCGGEIVPLANGIYDRLRERGNCLVAYLRLKGMDAVVARDKWDKLRFQTGKVLQVAFRLNNEVQPPQKLPAFFQSATDQTPPIFWLDADENFTDNGQPRDIAWEEVGAALCYAAAGLRLEDGTVFAGLLGCGEDSLKRKLLNLGVMEADIATALPPQTPQPSTQSTWTSQQSPFPASPARTGAAPIGRTGASGGHRGPGGARGLGGHGGGGGGGESAEHRQLKQRLAENPELIETGFHLAQAEYEFKSGDRADIICEDASGNAVAIEVESYIAPENEVGLWQAVKYKHLLAAERGRECRTVRAFLVAPEIPEDVKRRCAGLGIEPKEIRDA